MNILKLMSGTLAVSHGLLAGTFFAFSLVVLPTLGLMKPPQAIEFMQTTNKVIVASPWMIPFGLSTVLSLVQPLYEKFVLKRPLEPAHVAASLVFLLGAFVVTAALNVPLNDQLAKASPSDPAAWAAFAPAWNLWNVVRAASCSLAVLLLTLSPGGD